MPNQSIQVAEVFEPLFVDESIENIALEAGRDAGKSKTAYILSGVRAAVRPDEDIVICRASYGSIETSSYQETCEVMDSIPAFDGKFTFRKSPLRIVRKGGGTNIYFMGVGGSTDRTKGIKPKHKVGLLIVEEAQELRSKEHLDQLLASLRRRFGEHCQVLVIFNPPAQLLHWINVWSKFIRNDRDWLVIHSSWEDIIPFLNDRDIKEILKAKYENKTYYDYMYMGIPNGEGSVYPMLLKSKHVITVKQWSYVKEKANLRVLACVIGGDFAVNNDSSSLVPYLILNNGQCVVGPIFYHNPKDDAVIGYHQLVQNLIVRWFDELCRQFMLGTRQEIQQHPGMKAIPIFANLDNAAADAITEIKFFLGDRIETYATKKEPIPQMVATVQSCILNDNIIIIDYGGYFDYYKNRWVDKSENLLYEQWVNLTWNDRQDKYNDEIPNDVSDAGTYGILLWYRNQENMQFFNICRANNMEIPKIYDILNNKE